MVVWLHGFSLRGDDPDQLLEYGPPAVLAELPAEFVLLAPHLPKQQLAWRREALAATLVGLLADPRVDARRLALCGASLGAAAACDLVAAEPWRWNGLVLLAGAGDAGDAAALARVPLWSLHGTADAQVPIVRVRKLLAEVRRLSGTVRATELSDVGHDAAVLTRRAFVDERAIAWLLAQPPRSAAPPRAPLERQLGSVARIRDAAAAAKATLGRVDVPVPTPTDDQLFAWIEGLCATPHRRPGTAEGRLGERWVAARFTELGLQDVREDPVPIDVWQAERWQLTVDGKPLECGFLLNSGFTAASGVTAPLVLAAGRKDAELRGALVVVEAELRYGAGKADGRTFFAHEREFVGGLAAEQAAFPHNLLGDFLKLPGLDDYERARKAGAAGVVVATGDLLSLATSFYWPYDGTPKSLPALYCSREDSPRLLAAAKSGTEATLVQTGSVAKGVMHNVCATLPGASDDVLLITSHHDSAHRGGVEDASGIAQVLAQAWAWSQVPREQRPLTLVFVAAAGHFHKGQGALAFATAHPELLARCRAVLTLEHLPAREVRRGASGYEPTGRLQPVHVYASSHPSLLAAMWRTLDDVPPPFDVAVEQPLLGLPLSDVAGYLARSKEQDSGYPGRGGVPYLSWISAPLYLVDAADTPAMVGREHLAATVRTVTELVRRLMALP